MSTPTPALSALIEALMELIAVRNLEVPVLLRAARVCALWSSASSSSALHVHSRKLLAAPTQQERLRGLITACALLPTLDTAEALDLLSRSKRAAFRHPEFLGLLYASLAQQVRLKSLSKTLVQSIRRHVHCCFIYGPQ